jgi:hypothetical protein
MRDDNTDLETTYYRDPAGDRLMIGVRTTEVKLAVVVPDDVPRRKLEAAVAAHTQELGRFVDETGESSRADSGADERRQRG